MRKSVIRRHPINFAKPQLGFRKIRIAVVWRLVNTAVRLQSRRSERTKVRYSTLYGWFALAMTAFVSATGAADWPTQRHDAARSGISQARLSEPLELLWAWRLPRRNAVFGSDRRSRIDGAYDVTVVGKTLYMGCEYNDSVAAMDTETGRVKWRFYAEGAVRFSPTISKGRCYFGADDGRLYCLRAEDGKLIWRFDGAPAGRKIINHQRISSAWLVTGGAVVSGDVVSFSCGAWPLDGICVYGVNTETGKMIWRHDTFTAISNGYLSVRGGQLSLRVGQRGRFRIDPAAGKLIAAEKDNDPKLHWRKARDMWEAADRSNLPGGVRFADGWTPYYAIAQAGSQVFGAGMVFGSGASAADYGIVGLDEPDDGGKKPRVFFARKVDGRVLDTVCADDKLFVMTQNGSVYCFGARGKSKGVELELPKPQYGKSSDQIVNSTAEILFLTRRNEGFCLVWGLSDGSIVEELLRTSKLQICAVDPDADKVNALRRKFDRAGLYRDRLQLYVGEGASFEFPPYVADLIISENLPTSGLNRGEAFAKAVFRSLRPYGGTACFVADTRTRTVFAQFASGAKSFRAVFKDGKGLVRLQREGSLPGSADWTHEMRDSANSLCAPDQLARGPMSVLWFGGPAAETGLTYQEMLPPGLLVVDGRYIMQGPNKLTAIDVYTGRRLWQVPLPESQHNATHYGKVVPEYPGKIEGQIPVSEVSRGTGLNAAASSDAIYIAAGTRCLMLSSETGKTLKEFVVPIEGSDVARLCWGRLFVDGDLLIATAFDPGEIERCFSAWGNSNEKNKDRLPMQYIAAVNRRSGKLVWSRKAVNAFNNRAIAIGNGRVMCTDTLTPEVWSALEGRGRKPQPARPMVMAFDVKSGKSIWSNPLDIVATKISYSVDRDLLILPSRSPLVWKGDKWTSTAPPGADPKQKDTKTPGVMIAIRGADGKQAWRVGQFQYAEPVMIRGDTIVTRKGLTFRLQDGKPHRRPSALIGQNEGWSCPKGGCNYIVGGTYLMTSRTRYYDAEHHSGQAILVGMRSGCTPSIIPAGGVMCLLNYSSHSTDPYRSAAVFVHDPKAVNWKSYAPSADKAVEDRQLRRIALNIAAPGDHADSNGAIWFSQGLGEQNKKKKRPTNAVGVVVDIVGESLNKFGAHPLRLRPAAPGAVEFVAASGFEGVESIRIVLGGESAKKRKYAVRLHFAELDCAVKPAHRVFSVSIQGRNVLESFDIVKAASGPMRAIVRQFAGVEAGEDITIRFERCGTGRAPLLCGVEIVRDDFRAPMP